MDSPEQARQPALELDPLIGREEALVAVSLVREAPSRTDQTRFRVFEPIRQELARRTSAVDRDTFLARQAAAVTA